MSLLSGTGKTACWNILEPTASPGVWNVEGMTAGGVEDLEVIPLLVAASGCLHSPWV